MFALSTCARCAEPIPHNAPRCSRCRAAAAGAVPGAALERAVWDLCKKIKKLAAPRRPTPMRSTRPPSSRRRDYVERPRARRFICTESAARRHAANEGLVIGQARARDGGLRAHKLPRGASEARGRGRVAGGAGSMGRGTRAACATADPGQGVRDRLGVLKVYADGSTDRAAVRPCRS